MGEEDNSLAPNYFHNLDAEQRIKEYQIREIYWSYFRIGVRKLMKFYTILYNRVKKTEKKIKVPYESKLKEEVVEKLKVYIKELEEKIEANVSNLQEIRKVFRKHGIQDPDEVEDEDDE